MLWVTLFVTSLALCSAQLDNWQNYRLVWEDQFDGTSVNLSKWQYEITAWGGGNSEFEVYTNDPDVTYVNNGALYIKPKLFREATNPQTGQPFGEDFYNNGVLDLAAMYGSCTNSDNDGCVRGDGAGGDIPPVMSGRIRSFERFSFTFGRVRVRCRMPTGDWLWPAVWLLPELWEYGSWPVSGEIDISEIKGNEDLKDVNGNEIGHHHMGSTLHWGTSWQENRYYLTTAGKTNTTADYSREWHMLEMDWSPNGFRFVVDNDEFLNIPNPLIGQNPSWTGFWDFGAPWPPNARDNWSSSSNMAPFDKAFHFILNVAVGGTNYFFPDDGVNRGGDLTHVKPWSNTQNYYVAMDDFYAAQNAWYPTWTKEGDGLAMQVDFVEVWQLI